VPLPTFWKRPTARSSRPSRRHRIRGCPSLALSRPAAALLATGVHHRGVLVAIDGRIERRRAACRRGRARRARDHHRTEPHGGHRENRRLRRARSGIVNRVHRGCNQRPRMSGRCLRASVRRRTCRSAFELEDAPRKTAVRSPLDDSVRSYDPSVTRVDKRDGPSCKRSDCTLD
jgi:hypothetical protein